MNKLSVVLATFNEESNISDCLTSVKEIADEIVVVDGGSSDKTVEIAKSFEAEVILTDNPLIFHINKQKALEKASNEWILQLDADERVTKKLAAEISKIIDMNDEEIKQYQLEINRRDLFLRHQRQVEQRDGKIGKDDGLFVAFFIPRLNYFLGKFLRYGGVYPDGVIRLVKKGKAYFPCKSVHEQIKIDGKVGWLANELYHIDSPTLKRYLERNSRYINLISIELQKDRIDKSLIQLLNYCLVKPLSWFFMTQIRYKGILDGWQGVVFSFFSAMRFPRAYLRYLKKG